MPPLRILYCSKIGAVFEVRTHGTHVLDADIRAYWNAISENLFPYYYIMRRKRRGRKQIKSSKFMELDESSV